MEGMTKLHCDFCHAEIEKSAHNDAIDGYDEQSKKNFALKVIVFRRDRRGRSYEDGPADICSECHLRLRSHRGVR